jgi:hypothetical protein
LIRVSTGGTWCVPGGGIWASTPCPTANLVGTCQVPITSDPPFVGVRCPTVPFHYDRRYSPQWTTASANAACGSPGVVLDAGVSVP